MLFLVGAILFWGFSNFFMKLARGHLDSVSAMGWQALGGLFPLLTLLIYQGLNISFDKVGSTWAFFGGLFIASGGYLFLQSLGTVKISIAMPFSALNVLVTAFLGVFLLRESLTTMQIAGVVLMVGGAMLLGVSGGK
ncbi:MAG: DMT family transporter [Candidatus Sungiibacteriota bacterium]|uniref:DMT family transporter n=1 Tax=Candidatus Sungiibacteriota bacterium TaxID=2750080 RepID=A0A7T5RJ53_9BACT|nr:MAG: DMT family transporter [Candidatus Sungbacteria bacterium]